MSAAVKKTSSIPVPMGTVVFILLFTAAELRYCSGVQLIGSLLFVVGILAMSVLTRPPASSSRAERPEIEGVPKHRPFFLAIEGIIGAGKTTLIEVLRENLASRGYIVTVIKEPVDKWKEILPKFYADPKRWGYHFQTKAFSDRVLESCEMFEKHAQTTDIFLMERTWFSDCVFMRGLHEDGSVGDMEMKHYQQWWEMWSRIVPFVPDLFLYLRPSINTCMGRVKSRLRDGECDLPEKYQTQLERYHDEFFKDTVKIGKTKTVPCVRIGDGEDCRRIQDVANSNFKDDPKIQLSICTQVAALIEGVQSQSAPISTPTPLSFPLSDKTE